jgi:hypothetical protein
MRVGSTRATKYPASSRAVRAVAYVRSRFAASVVGAISWVRKNAIIRGADHAREPGILVRQEIP